jgi:hypothetical protein
MSRWPGFLVRVGLGLVLVSCTCHLLVSSQSHHSPPGRPAGHIQYHDFYISFFTVVGSYVDVPNSY